MIDYVSAWNGDVAKQGGTTPIGHLAENFLSWACKRRHTQA